MGSAKKVIVLVLGIGFVAATLLTINNRAANSLAMPAELFQNNPSFRAMLATNTTTEKCSIGFDSYQRKVVVKRKERNDPGVPYGPGDVDTQFLSASYDISAIAWGIDSVPVLDSIYVAGTDPVTGDSKVERWKFTYGSGGPGGFNNSPTETRTTLYSGTSIGYIRSIEVDNKQRFALILTYDGSIYQLETQASGGVQPPPPVLLYDVTVIPQLEHARMIELYQHVADGYMFMVHLADTEPETVVLPDADDNGQLEQAIVYSNAQWESNGYSDLMNFIPFFRTTWFPDFGQSTP